MRPFHAGIDAVDGAVREAVECRAAHACPARLESLRRLTVSHWDFEDGVRTGVLVVHADHADALVGVFRAIFHARFPIERMELREVLSGVRRSPGPNNSSGYMCREVAGRPGVWSQHAYGLAIDLNPVQNPYVWGERVIPPGSEDYLDRCNARRGMILPNDAVVTAFASIGWGWGGVWREKKDYQHFSSTGL